MAFILKQKGSHCDACTLQRSSRRCEVAGALMECALNKSSAITEDISDDRATADRNAGMRGVKNIGHMKKSGVSDERDSDKNS